MMIRQALLASLSLASMMTNVAALGEDYLADGMAPKTVYEAEEMSPQNMDFDMEKNMFKAHSGWYNDKLIHYYKFRMYTPGTYKDLIKMGSTAADVPLAKVFMTTTDGTLAGSVGKPIIEYHTADGNMYSDFMEVMLVTVPADYVADTYKSVGDINSSGITPEATGIVLNLPVVPTGSTMEDPAELGMAAPIDPVMVWYKGAPVTTYVFEVTDESAKTFFASTRTMTDDVATSRRKAADYDITVVDFASATAVRAIPLWHVNQFSNGVTEGVNGGGPSPMGQRNIINLDRGDLGYSPLWGINWVTELPINYSADQASSNTIMTTDNGFVSVVTPMFVNCPDIGAVGELNGGMLTEFQTKIDTDDMKSHISGSHMSLIMQGDVEVMIQTEGGEEVAKTMTNMMGAYELEIPSADIPVGTDKLVVMAKGEKIRMIEVEDMRPEPGTSASPVVSLSWMASVGLVVLAAVAM